MMWYEYLGGRKAYQGILAAICGLIVWFSIPEQARTVNFVQMLVFFLAVFGFYIFGNINEYRVKNGGGNGAKQ